MKKKLGISLLFIMLLLCGCGGGAAPGSGAAGNAFPYYCSAPGNILPKESVEIGFYGVSRKKPKVKQFRLYTLTSDYDYLLGDDLGYKNFFLE